MDRSSSAGGAQHHAHRLLKPTPASSEVFHEEAHWHHAASARQPTAPFGGRPLRDAPCPMAGGVARAPSGDTAAITSRALCRLAPCSAPVPHSHLADRGWAMLPNPGGHAVGHAVLAPILRAQRASWAGEARGSPHAERPHAVSGPKRRIGPPWRSGKGHARSRDCDVTWLEPAERPQHSRSARLWNRFAWCSAATKRQWLIDRLATRPLTSLQS